MRAGLLYPVSHWLEAAPKVEGVIPSIYLLWQFSGEWDSPETL